MLALTEAKLKENENVSWFGVMVPSGVEEIERAREGEGVLMNDVLHSAAIDWMC